MKKVLIAAALILMLCLASCSDSAPEENPAAQNGAEVLPGGSWPENEYTNGLPVCPGEVTRAEIDAENGHCGIFLSDVSRDEYTSYMSELKKGGFDVITEQAEDIEGQDYESYTALLSDGERWLSISYIPGSFGMYISFVE
jgi:hypothetical protein